MTRPAPSVSPALPPPWGVAGALGTADGSGGGIPAATAPDAAGARTAPRTPARASTAPAARPAVPTSAPTAPPCPPHTPLAAAQPPAAAGDREGAARGTGGHEGTRDGRGAGRAYRLPDRVPNGLTVLDTFCCSGGMGMGYYLAGFTVVGVDLHPQPNYPFPFVQGDAVQFIRDHGAEYDLIHGSPPCQDYSNLNAYNRKEYPRLIEPTREAMIATGRPYVIENVEAAAPELKDPTLLCGPMFGLQMYRHRLLETSFPLTAPEHPKHTALCTRNGYLPTPQRPFMTITGGAHSRAWQNATCDAMGMPWIKVEAGGDIKRGIREVCEAIPPVYATWIGRQAAAHIEAARRPVQLALDLDGAAEAAA